jgi:hypothetical protein
MKRWLTMLFVLIVIALMCTYVFIPNVITLQSNITINVTRQALYRTLLDKKHAYKWWPDNGNATLQQMLYGYTYDVRDNNISLLPVVISKGGQQLSTSLYLISEQPEIVRLQWLGEMPTSYNPFKRYAAYSAAKKIRKGMKEMLQKLNSFLSKPENIYGHEIHHLLITDSTFISTIDTLREYPSTSFIYDRINQLKSYAAAYSLQASGYPILNINDEDSTRYVVRVAIPLPKSLPSHNNILEKRMPVNVNILMIEVKGGNAVVSEAFRQLLYYIDDRHKTMPGIPFFSLVTDRVQEPDSNKWVTRIYCPVR